MASVEARAQKIFAATHPKGPAELTRNRVLDLIGAFEASLDADHEVGGNFVTFAGRSFHITDVGFWGEETVMFYGLSESGEPLTLIQHVSQVNVMLVAVKKQDSIARRIGIKQEQAAS